MGPWGLKIIISVVERVVLVLRKLSMCRIQIYSFRYKFRYKLINNNPVLCLKRIKLDLFAIWKNTGAFSGLTHFVKQWRPWFYKNTLKTSMPIRHNILLKFDHACRQSGTVYCERRLYYFFVVHFDGFVSNIGTYRDNITLTFQKNTIIIHNFERVQRA